MPGGRPRGWRWRLETRNNSSSSESDESDVAGLISQSESESDESDEEGTQGLRTDTSARRELVRVRLECGGFCFLAG
jgi:hypothetical protein